MTTQLTTQLEACFNELLEEVQKDDSIKEILIAVKYSSPNKDNKLLKFNKNEQ